jgi:hypothetical protein
MIGQVALATQHPHAAASDLQTRRFLEVRALSTRLTWNLVIHSDNTDLIGLHFAAVDFGRIHDDAIENNP